MNLQSRRRTQAFLAVEGALYLTFLTMDICGWLRWSTPLKYAGILLCVLFCLPGDRRMAAALVLTALADLFLLVLDRYYAVGVVLFCGVQALYLLRIRRAGGWPPAVCIGVRAALALGALGAAAALGCLTPLTALAAVYFSQLLSNAAESWFHCRGRRSVQFAAGLTLFVLCDVCVGLNYLSAPLHWSQVGMFVFGMFALLGMWLFYLPAQVLLALSAQAAPEAKS